MLLQSKHSNSNPTIHEQSKSPGHAPSASAVGTSWMEDVLKEYNNVAGNRYDVLLFLIFRCGIVS